MSKRKKEILSGSDTSYNRYIAVCQKAIEDDSIFQNFKVNPEYTYELEHTSVQAAYNYIELLLTAYFDELKKLDWNAVRKNDICTNTSRTFFKNQLHEVIQSNNSSDYLFSPTTLGYLWTAFAMVNHLINHGITNEINVVEIGAGYGGQCLLFHIVAKHYGITVNSYTLIDLYAASELQKKYLTTVDSNLDWDLITNLQFVECLDIKESNRTFEKIDLVVSNYCFSEISKEWGSIYMEKIIKKSTCGFFKWNNKSIMADKSARCKIRHGHDDYFSFNQFNKSNFPNLSIEADPQAVMPQHQQFCRVIKF